MGIHLGIFGITQCQVPELQSWLRNRAEMHRIVKHNLERAQTRMKMQADKNRIECSFTVGDWVYLKLQPYVQLSVARRSNQKLSYRYFGPYLILQKVGEVAYKLQLPPGSQVHPVVHVSQLKKALPPSTEVSPDADLSCISVTSPLLPVQLRDIKHCKVGNWMIPKVQVQWSNLPPSWVTWENLNTLQATFPDCVNLIVG